MLLDEDRVKRYREAIFETVKPGDIVIDVGSGSGVLAILAAQAGAQKVYAIERTSMAELLQENVAANELQDTIEIKRVDVLQLNESDFPVKPNVVIGEMLGNFAPDEDQHRLYGFVKQLVSEDTRWLPKNYNLVFAPVQSNYLHSIERELVNSDEVNLTPIFERLIHRPHLKKMMPDELLGEECHGPAFPTASKLPKVFNAHMEIAKDGILNGFIVGFQSQLSKTVTLTATTTGPKSSHWFQVLFPIYPFRKVQKGELLEVEVRPRLITHRGTWSWKVTCGDQVHYGDAMKSLVGSNDEIAQQLGLRFTQTGEKKSSELLDMWADILDGSSEGSLIELAERLQAKRPTAYPVIEDAIQDVRKLLKASAALA